MLCSAGAHDHVRLGLAFYMTAERCVEQHGDKSACLAITIHWQEHCSNSLQQSAELQLDLAIISMISRSDMARPHLQHF